MGYQRPVTDGMNVEGISHSLFYGFIPAFLMEELSKIMKKFRKLGLWLEIRIWTSRIRSSTNNSSATFCNVERSGRGWFQAVIESIPEKYAMLQ
jgi:hypothetical protein